MLRPVRLTLVFVSDNRAVIRYPLTSLATSSSWPLDSRDSSILGVLCDMETRIMNKEDVPLSELRAGLRRAATILCRAANSHYSIVALFVRLPFLAFSKNTIKMGLTLWIGVLKENPKLESRILMEIIENWTISVNHKFGIFSPRLRLDCRDAKEYHC